MEMLFLVELVAIIKLKKKKKKKSKPHERVFSVQLVQLCKTDTTHMKV